MPLETIFLSDRAEYDYITKRGHEPLLDYKHFTLDIFLRVELQRELFGHCTHGRGNIPQTNERFFRWLWDHKPHYCEETMRPLFNYSAVYCSHILTRGAHSEMAHDPRNINLLCFEIHNRWEHGDKSKMRIYQRNIEVIELMKTEYLKFKRC